MSEKLTIKEQAFADAYLGEARGNGTEACRIAGYESKRESLAVLASRLLRKVKVSEYIQARLEERKITAENVLNEIASIAFNKFEKASDRNKSLELLGKYLKLFSENVIHSGEVNMNHTLSFDEWKQKAEERLNQVLESDS